MSKTWSLKALVNEDTLLRTHGCPWCFLGCANWETFVADTKCFWTKSETFLCTGHKICVSNKCCARGQMGKHLCRQQCVLVFQGLKDSILPYLCFLSQWDPNLAQSLATFTDHQHVVYSAVWSPHVARTFASASGMMKSSY